MNVNNTTYAAMNPIREHATTFTHATVDRARMVWKSNRDGSNNDAMLSVTNAMPVVRNRSWEADKLCNARSCFWRIAAMAQAVATTKPAMIDVIILSYDLFRDIIFTP